MPLALQPSASVRSKWQSTTGRFMHGCAVSALAAKRLSIRSGSCATTPRRHAERSRRMLKDVQACAATSFNHLSRVVKGPSVYRDRKAEQAFRWQILYADGLYRVSGDLCQSPLPAVGESTKATDRCGGSRISVPRVVCIAPTVVRRACVEFCPENNLTRSLGTRLGTASV
jgi:hypothetical protein